MRDTDFVQFLTYDNYQIICEYNESKCCKGISLELANSVFFLHNSLN